MKSRTFMRVDDVARELCISESYAYKLIKKLNKELNDMGYITMPGRVNKKYFCEKVCYGDYDERDE